MKYFFNSKLKFLLISITLIHLNNVKAQLQQIYSIGQSDLINVPYGDCDGFGNYYGDDIGFTWTDNLPSGAIINSITIEYYIGINCGSTSATPTLNSNSQTSVSYVGDCNCSPTTTSQVIHSVNTANYNPNGTNTYELSGTSTIGFNSHSSLSGNYAIVTIDYSSFSGPTPTLSSFSPSSGSCNTVVTINGTNFNNGTPIVKFNGVTATHTYVSSTQLTATVPVGVTAGTITVQTGGGIASSSSNFSFNSPTISSFSPSSATCNTQVTINGTNFNSSSTVVKFNGITANHTYVSATQLTATVPAGNTSGVITVQTCNAITASSSSNFTLSGSAPTISSVSSSAGTRGTMISITGTNLTCPSAVTFGGTAAFSFNGTSSTSITAEVGYGTSGNIVVTTGSGSATFSGFTYTAPSAASTTNITGNSSTNTITNNSASIVDNGISVSSNGTINGFIVTITDSYQTGDVLAYNSTTGGALPASISVASFNTTTRSLVFSGSAIGSDWERILRNVTLTTTSAVCSPESRKISFIAGDVFYNPLNGHFYKASTTSSSWTDAKTNAENLSYFGKQGYLTTITSQAENSFISKLLSMNSWIGCTDRYSEINTSLGYTLYAAASSVTVSGTTYSGTNSNGYAEGQWYWVTGPEKGTRMRSGNAINQNSYNLGTEISGVYQNWQANEPNDYNATSFGDEDYGHIFTGAGDWNDFPNSSFIGSVIEFGDMPGDNVSSSINTVFTRTIYINGAPSGTITGGNVSVCYGSNSTTLTLTGLASGGTVTSWEYSLDNFLTSGVSVSSTSTSLTITNITETRYYRAIVSTTSCTGLATSSTRIGVATTTAGSIVSNKSAICTGGSTELTLSGNIGSVVRWERSTSSTFASGVTTISNTTTTLTETLNTAGTYYYRNVVQQSGCGSAVNSNGYPVTVTTGTPPVGGTISNTSSCSGTNSITLTLSGHSGNITKWQYSTDGGYVWNVVNNTTTSLTQTNITSNRKYRAIISTTNTACGNESSSSGEVTVFGSTVVRWDGTNSKNSKTSGNWCGGIPTNGQDILISASASNNLMLEEDKTLGIIDFNGSSRIIELGNYNLVATELKGLGSSSYVKTNGTGKLKINLNPNTPVLYPVGNTTYNPVTITNKTGSSDEIGVRVIDNVYTDGTSGSIINSSIVNATWDISKTNANSGSGLDFTFQWNSSQEQGTMSTYKLNHYKNAAWEIAAGTSGTPSGSTTKTMTHTGYTGTFSPFAIGGTTTALPIGVINFNATPNNNSVDLTWTSYSEIKNPFNILKSNDGVKWTPIGTLNAADNSVHYLFTDHKPAAINYYQLSQIDNSNTLQYSDIRIVNFNINKLVIFPNPNNSEFTIQSNNFVNFQIIDYTGKVIMGGDNSNPLIKTNLTKGIYFIKITEVDKTTFSKIIVQ